MTTQERVINYVLQVGHKVNCGSSILTLLPFVLFVVYFWLLAGTYIIALLHPNNRPHNSSITENQWGKYFLMQILTLVLVFSGAHCWSYGLIHFLDKYTFVVLTMINNSFKSNYTMKHTTMLTLESTSKLVICCSVVYLIRYSYLTFKSNYEYQQHQRMLRRVRLYDWPTYVFRPEIESTELGQEGILLRFDHAPPRPENNSLSIENSNTTKVRHIQSCIWPQKIGKIIKAKKRNSI